MATIQKYSAEHAQARDTFLDEAIAAGKFPASRRHNYAVLFDVNPESARQLVAKLAAGIPPARIERAERGDEYDQSWLSSSERSRIDGARAGTYTPVTVSHD